MLPFKRCQPSLHFYNKNSRNSPIEETQALLRAISGSVRHLGMIWRAAKARDPGGEMVNGNSMSNQRLQRIKENNSKWMRTLFAGKFIAASAGLPA
jgi:hypothetical protein